MVSQDFLKFGQDYDCRSPYQDPVNIRCGRQRGDFLVLEITMQSSRELKLRRKTGMIEFNIPAKTHVCRNTINGTTPPKRTPPFQAINLTMLSSSLVDCSEINSLFDGRVGFDDRYPRPFPLYSFDPSTIHTFTLLHHQES